MDFNMRLKALTRLAQSETEAARTALQKELERVAASLGVDTQYDHLEQHLDVLAVISHRFSSTAVKILLTFIQEIESREISYSRQGRLFEMREYYNVLSLIVRAVDALMQLRYLETKSVLHALLKLSKHGSDDVRTKAIEGLKALAAYDMRVFYGDGTVPGIGATPQKQIIDEIELFTEDDLTNYFTALVTLVNNLLSPSIHGTSWSYKSVTLSQGAIPAHPTVADIRLHSINLLKRMYGIANTTAQKIEIISILNDATRKHHIGKKNEEISNMIARDTVDVLSFFSSLIQREDLQIIQQIESNSYWIFYHAARSDVKDAALAVQAAIAKNSEYQIYKVLIGFEGVFGDWSELREKDSEWEKDDEFRKAKASEYAASITSENYSEWRRRILKYAETQSEDMATFPVFYYFLECFATVQPPLALQLISDDTEQIKYFLIPLLRSLWAGPQRDETRRLIKSWIEQGHFLYQSTRQFLENANYDVELLESLLHRATDLEDLHTVTAVMSVAVSNYSNDKTFLIDRFFIPALEVLTERSNVNWIFDSWFRRETRVVIQNLSEHGINLVLRNLLALKKIDYHAEEFLYLIAKRAPEKVIQFLCKRLTANSQNSEIGSSTFDAIPYELHKLNEPLSRIHREAVRVVREQYDGGYPLFIFRGARLLKIIFPQFPSEFEVELLNLVEAGGNDNLEFVLAILRNYEGEPFIHKVCKEILRSIPKDSQYRTEVCVALENTGVVQGEFGFAEAYERKKSEMKDWIVDPDEKIQEFAKWYIARMDQMSVAERKRAEEEIALRKYQYGEQE